MEYLQVLVWMALFVGLSVLALPIVSVVFASLPGRGAGFAPAVAFGTVALVAYWIGHLHFGLATLVASLLVLGVGTVAAVRRGPGVEWRAFAESMGVFGVGFLFVVAVRAFDPGIVPFQEDFLDYGMMRAVLRARTLPPEDFWFAGERVRYHYGGHLVAALQTTLTETEPPVAYNLALAGFFGMLLSGSYELAGAIAAANGQSRRVAGAFGAYFVGFAGNMLVPFAAFVQALPESARTDVGSIIADDLGYQAGRVVLIGFDDFEYWDVLETVPDVLTPYPLFAWFHGELHAHVTSATFLVLLVGLCYAYFRTPEGERTRRRLLAFVAVPLGAGFTVLVDTLTAPMSLGVIWLALLFAPADSTTLVPARARNGLRALRDRRLSNGGTKAHSLRDELDSLMIATAFTVVSAGLVVAVAAPFLLFTLGGGEESVALVPADERTGFFGLLVVHGAFLVLFALFLGRRIKPLLDGTSTEVLGALVVAVPLLAVVSFLAQLPILLLVAPLIVGGWIVLRADRGRFETLLVVAGAGLVVLVEFVYIANQEYVIDGRGNTVFRAYWHVWLLWGVAAGVILPRLLRLPETPPRRIPARETVYAALAVGLLLASSGYGAISVYQHFDEVVEPPEESWEPSAYIYEATQMRDHPYPPTQPPSLNGLMYGEVEYPYETAAIKWLDGNVEGSPVILTAPGGRWEWRSAAATLTGIPTVAGWGHELVYRDSDLYYDRVDDVRSMYRGSPERRIELLERYGVRYVYVGPDELERYDVWEFTLLDGVSVAYRNEGVSIYRIDQDQLGYSTPSVSTTRYTGSDLGTDGSVATSHDGTITASGPTTDGTFAWWGPYVELPPGNYVATFRIRVNETGTGGPAASEQGVVIDVARGALSESSDVRVLGRASMNETGGIRNVTIPFTLARPAGDVEFRGRIPSSSTNATLHGVTLERVAANETESAVAGTQ